MTEANRQYVDVWHRTGDGVRIHARDYEQSGDGQRPTLVCLHGLSRNAADFATLAARLPQYRLLVIEQRGRGKSDVDPDPSRYDVGRYVEDTLGLLAALEIRRPVLVGTSMGGLMAMLMLARDPAGYRGALLNDIGPVVEAAGLARIQGYVGKVAPAADWAAAAAATRSSNAVAFPDYADADWLAFARRLYRQRPDGMLEPAYDPAIALPLGNGDPEKAVPPDLWSVFDLLGDAPLLVVRGALSDILSATTVTEMQRRHPALQAVEVPRVGHAPMLDEPEAFEAFERFLAGLAELA